MRKKKVTKDNESRKPKTALDLNVRCLVQNLSHLFQKPENEGQQTMDDKAGPRVLKAAHAIIPWQLTTGVSHRTLPGQT